MRTAELTLPWVLESEANWTRHFADATAFFVNAYEVTQSYGGPEEGGWWYDVGDTLASVPVEDYGDAVETYVHLHNRLAERYADGDRCRNRPELSLCVENHFAAAFPTERPRYE